MNQHWPLTRLGDIFDISRGGSPRPIEKFITDDPAGLNWIKIGDATSGGKFIERTREKIKREGLSKTRAVKPGDFLLTNSMSFGRPYIMATEGCIHDGWLLLRPRTIEVVHPDYFYHLLGSDQLYNQFSARAGGSTVKNLNSDIVSSIEIRLPPFGQQQRIAAILDKADALRRKRKRALELLDGLTQSVFASMFGDLVATQQFPRGNIGQWVADFETGKNLAPDPDDMTPGYRVLKVSAVTSGNFDPDESKPLPANYTPPTGHLVEKGDLLFSRANTEELIGATALVERSYEKLVLPDKIWRFVWSRTNPPDPVFIRELFRSAPLRREISKRATGTSGSMKNISKEKVLQIGVGMPSRERQTAFSKIASQSSAVTASMTAQLAEFEQQFSSLQHRAFTGQL